MILIWIRAVSVNNASQPRKPKVTRIRLWGMSGLWRWDSKMSKNTSFGILARRYGNLSGALPRDNALGHHWPRSVTRDCQDLNNHKCLNICMNGANEESIRIYAKSKCQWSGWLIKVKIIQQFYGGLELLGASNPSG